MAGVVHELARKNPEMNMFGALFERACRFAGRFEWLKGGQCNELREDRGFVSLGVRTEDVLALAYLVGLLCTALAIGMAWLFVLEGVPW